MHGGIQKIAGPQENGLKPIKQQIGTIRTILAPAHLNIGSKYFLPMQHIKRTQLLFATSIEGGIHDSQVLKYQPSVTSRVISYHFASLIIIKY